MKLFNRFSEKRQAKKQLIIITGCAGSGKTTVGTELAKQLGYAYVDKDTVTREYTDFILTKLGSSEGDRESDLYKNEILPIEYKVTLKVCDDVIKNGANVVLTIPFIAQIRDYQKWEQLCDQSNINKDVDVKFIWIEHDIDTEKKNIKNRGATRDRHKIEHWDEYAESVDGIEPAPEYNAYIYVNDCDAELSDTLEEVKRWINR